MLGWTYLDSCFESKKGISRIAHLKDPAESILCQISNLQYLQLGRHTPQVQLIDQNVVDDYRGFWRFIQSCGEHLLSSFVKVRICRQRRPIEIERHVEGPSVFADLYESSARGDGGFMVVMDCGSLSREESVDLTW